MARKRHHRAKHEVITPWPGGHLSPDEISHRVVYVGSPEHKDYPSTAGPPALRSDAARCEPRLTSFDQITLALQEAIRRQCIGAHFDGDFPRHVWGWLGGRLYEARLINQVQGWYKAWPIEDVERPRDEARRLVWE